MNKSSYLLYEADSAYDVWIKLLFIAIPAVTLIVGLVMLVRNNPDHIALFGITVFYILLFHCIMPRKLQIYNDRLRVILGKPIAFSISFDKIQHVRHASGSKAHAYWGVRWATSSQHVVEIRKKGMNMVISPENSAAFVEQMNDALERYRAAG